MARYHKATRIAEFKHCAHALDWRFLPDDTTGILPWLKDFQLCRRGHSKRIGPVIVHKHDDLELQAAFDFVYKVSTNNSSATYRQTVYFRYSKALALPHFLLMPERWYHRIGTWLGMQDIDFTEYPKFSHNYLLQGGDEPYIRHHFQHPDMIRFFDRHDQFYLEGMNYLMVLYVHNLVLPATQIKQLIHIGDTLHDFFSDRTPGIALPPDEQVPAEPDAS